MSLIERGWGFFFKENPHSLLPAMWLTRGKKGNRACPGRGIEYQRRRVLPKCGVLWGPIWTPVPCRSLAVGGQDVCFHRSPDLLPPALCAPSVGSG